MGNSTQYKIAAGEASSADTSLTQPDSDHHHDSANHHLYHDVDVEAEGERYRRRRRVTIAAIVVIFVVAAGIMVMSVVHDIRSRSLKEYIDFSCSESDTECLVMLCPEAHVWDSQAEECQLLPGYTCCADSSGLKLCFEEGEERTNCSTRQVDSAGVAPFTFKTYCRDGYMWVEWKKKCLRKAA